MIDFSYKNETSRMIIVRCVGEKSFFYRKSYISVRNYCI